MRRQVLVSLLITRVFGDEVEVFSTDDEGTVHFRGHDTAGQDTSYVEVSMGFNYTIFLGISPRIETMPVKGHFLSM